MSLCDVILFVGLHVVNGFCTHSLPRVILYSMLPHMLTLVYRERVFLCYCSHREAAGLSFIKIKTNSKNGPEQHPLVIQIIWGFFLSLLCH